MESSSRQISGRLFGQLFARSETEGDQGEEITYGPTLEIVGGGRGVVQKQNQDRVA